MLAESEFDSAKVCPPIVISVSAGAGIVKACASPWFDGGNVLDYVGRHADANRKSLVYALKALLITKRLTGSLDIRPCTRHRACPSERMDTVQYSSRMFRVPKYVSSPAQTRVHGQGNVMVKQDGHAVLVDVGMPALTSLYMGDGRIPAMCAYKPPEQLRPPELLPTQAMDTYAYATTSYAVSAFFFLIDGLLSFIWW